MKKLKSIYAKSIAFSVLTAALIGFLASCAPKPENRVVVVITPAVLRVEATPQSKAVRMLNLYEEMDAPGELVAFDANNKYFKVKSKTGEKGFVSTGVGFKGYSLGIVREKTAYKDSESGAPSGFLEGLTPVLVSAIKTKDKAVLSVRFRPETFWKDVFVDKDAVALNKKDTEIFSVVLPTLESYAKKAREGKTPEASKQQIELALAYIKEKEGLYSSSEFYSEVVKKKDEFDAIVHGTGKVLENETNNQYETSH